MSFNRWDLYTDPRPPGQMLIAMAVGEAERPGLRVLHWQHGDIDVPQAGVLSKSRATVTLFASPVARAALLDAARASRLIVAEWHAEWVPGAGNPFGLTPVAAEVTAEGHTPTGWAAGPPGDWLMTLTAPEWGDSVSLAAAIQQAARTLDRPSPGACPRALPGDGPTDRSPSGDAPVASGLRPPEGERSTTGWS